MSHKLNTSEEVVYARVWCNCQKLW